MHCRENIMVLAHAKIVIGTPDRHFSTNALIVPRRTREFATAPLQIGKNTVSTFPAKAIELTLEKFLIFHATFSLPRMIFQVLR
jgi:hypothetical protein